VIARSVSSGAFAMSHSQNEPSSGRTRVGVNYQKEVDSCSP
jgi:hypothetical protein